MSLMTELNMIKLTTYIAIMIIGYYAWKSNNDDNLKPN